MHLEQLIDAAPRQFKHGTEFAAGKSRAFGGSLNFDKPALVIHNDIHIGFGTAVFGVIEVEYRFALVNTDRYGGYLVVNWISLQRTLV